MSTGLEEHQKHQRVVSMTGEELQGLIQRGIAAGLRDIGMYTDDSDDVEKLRADFRFMRRMRESTENAVSKIGLALLLTSVTAIFGALALGIKAWIAALR